MHKNAQKKKLWKKAAEIEKVKKGPKGGKKGTDPP